MPAALASCFTCGTALTANGDCLPCLVRVGFDASDGVAASFGDYEIERREDGSLRELGRGAMGVTYRATDSVLHRSVALKVIEAPHGGDRGQRVRDRFLREARATASFRHPNVASVFHFGASPDGQRCYYAMELVEGETLEARVRREGPLKVEAALEIAVQVTQALVAAGAQGLVHRDLKPGNIMLTPALGSETSLGVKVIDFGLAKAVSNGANEMDLTKGEFVGTPAFASPEQFSGSAADARSDIYSLGVTLWYALTGEVPYEGRSIDEIRRAQSDLPLPLEKLIARKIPKEVIQLLRRILSQSPAERPSSARELMSDLEGCRKGLGMANTDERRTWRGSQASIAALGVLALCVALFAALRSTPRKDAAVVALPAAKSIAVLPFQNLSDDKANAYFADGVQDEILTTLAKVADLKVISRTSVMQFRDIGNRNLRDVGQQLGAAHVLEGSVQRAGDRVRVTAQLIDARTDAHVWAEQYDGEVADVLEFQSAIAQKIVGELKAALSPSEQTALVARATADPEAYDLYLRARQLQREGGTGSMAGLNALEQIKLLDQAVARDPAFVSALCMLAQAHLRAFWFKQDHTPGRLELAKSALESAARLQRDAGEVHLTRALFHYWGSRAYGSALAELAFAGRTLPNDVDVLFYIGAIERRQGRWDESARALERALDLDPRNSNTALDLSWTYRHLRRYADARRLMDSVLAWKPEDMTFQFIRADIDLLESGDLTRLRQVLSREMPPKADANLVAIYRHRLALFERNYGAALEALTAYRLPEITSLGFSTPVEYYEGMAASGLGDAARAEDAFRRARERAAATVAARPGDAKALMILAKADAKVGRKEDAVRGAERAVELLPVAADTFDGPLVLGRLAEVYAEVGETDRALEILQKAAALPGGAAYGVLKLGEEFDALRNDARFDAILAALAPKSGT